MPMSMPISMPTLKSTPIPETDCVVSSIMLMPMLIPETDVAAPRIMPMSELISISKPQTNVMKPCTIPRLEPLVTPTKMMFELGIRSLSSGEDVVTHFTAFYEL